MDNKISVGSLIIGVWRWHLSHFREYVSQSLVIVGPKISFLFNAKDARPSEWNPNLPSCISFIIVRV